MARKRKPTVDDKYDRSRRNDPESANLSHEEVALFENARQAIGLLKKTFETWTVIGKAVVAARARADRAGGGKTFARILQQQGLAKIVPPATATRLIEIMGRLPEVSAWHAGLSDQKQIAWAAPSTVVKHCPVFAKGKQAKQPAKPGKGNIAFGFTKETTDHQIFAAIIGSFQLARVENIANLLRNFIDEQTEQRHRGKPTIGFGIGATAKRRRPRKAGGSKSPPATLKDDHA